MKSVDVRKKYLEYYKNHGHVEIPSAPLVPDNDSTTLFTSSGMQPLVPYLLGQKHPSGERLVDSQKSFRAQDIEEVGDNRHTTFFEMLGNWSLGDYFKEKQLPWIFEFLTKEINLDPNRLYVSVFEGNSSVPKDSESVDIWKQLFADCGINAKIGERIYMYPARKNWWSRSGEPENMPPGEPGGPDSEVFFDFGEELRLHEQSPWKNEKCHPNCDCGRFMEIANSVFMQYQKLADGSLKELKQKNVDFGGGLERMVAATENSPDVFKTDLFWPLIDFLTRHLNVSYDENLKMTQRLRVIADHLKAATFLISDGVLPGNKQQGYVLRRLLRRAAVKLELIQKDSMSLLEALVEEVLKIYEDTNYFAKPTGGKSYISTQVINTELNQFKRTLSKGLKEMAKIDKIDGKSAFDMYQTYGFPLEITEEIFAEKGQIINHVEFENEFNKHKNLSRTASAGMFKGGLADHSEQTTKLHTAHHLLLASLQKLVSSTIRQRGSNITAERLRMDFNFERKLTSEELKKVEQLVNEVITQALPVQRIDMDKAEAEKIGAQMEFGKKYPDRVSVYFIGSKDSYFSAEFCGGPHVSNTKTIGKFTITKEESAGAGIRRIYGTIA